MVRRVTSIAIAAAFALTAAHGLAQVPPLTRVMNEKAENAQRILRPLVIGDFVGIESYAERLGRLTYTEIGAWQGSADTEYLAQATAFVHAVQDLRTASRDRDLSGASSAYAALIDSCVQCHRRVRGQRGVSLAPPAPTLDVPRWRSRVFQ